MVSCNESSSYASNSCNIFSATFYLDKSKCNLGKLLVDDEYDYADAEIVVDGITIGVHRCILALRSQFFHKLFKRGKDRSVLESKPKYYISELMPLHDIGYESFMFILNYLYTGELKPPPPEVATCVDDSCVHDACGPAINLVVELLYLSSTFEMKELVEILQHRLVNFLSKAFVEDVIPILKVAFHCQLKQLFSNCALRIVQEDQQILRLEKVLTQDIWDQIKLLRVCSLNEFEIETSLKEKWIRRIYKSLDFDDIELLELLLDESNITLNDAYALHYAAAYCDHKVVKKLLNLGRADLNLRDPQGFTALHVAARVKDPSVISDLLDKGALISKKTCDGRTVVTMCRRMTSPKDYYKKLELGQESCKDRESIDLLEAAYHKRELEIRVAFVRLLFPAEARMAMDITVNSTIEFGNLSASSASPGNLNEIELNEDPPKQEKLQQLRALEKVVDTWRCYFPNCSEVLDRLMKDEHLGMENSDPEEQRIVLMEYEEDIAKAFYKDKDKCIRTDDTSSPSNSETADTLLLERAKKLLRVNTERRTMQPRRIEKAMLTFDIDKAPTNWTNLSTSSSCSVSPFCGP